MPQAGAWGKRPPNLAQEDSASDLIGYRSTRPAVQSGLFWRMTVNAVFTARKIS